MGVIGEETMEPAEGKENRKVDVLFFKEKTGLLYAPMRYQVYSNKAGTSHGSERYNIEFFVFNK